MGAVAGRTTNEVLGKEALGNDALALICKIESPAFDGGLSLNLLFQFSNSGHNSMPMIVATNFSVLRFDYFSFREVVPARLRITCDH